MSGHWASSFRLFAIAMLAALCLAPIAQAKEDFLPPERAYTYSTRVDGDRLIVTWKIEKGYYLYKQKLGIASASSVVRLNTPAWPKGELHKDEFFGEQEIYRGTVEIPVAMSIEGVRPAKLPVELKLQGCADAGLCYPPLTWKTDVAIPATGAEKKGLRSLFTSSKVPATANEEFLPPDEAFKFGAAMERPDSVALTWIIADGYYLYKDRIEVATDSQIVQLGKPVLPKGKPKFDEYFGNTEVYYEFAEASVPVARAAGSTGTLNLKVTYQGCAEDGLCYNPITKEVALELPPTDVASALPASSMASTPGAGSQDVVAEQDSLAALIRNGNVAAVLGVFFALGVGLAFTPCVLPMIPILSGIVVGQGDKLTPMRGFSLAFAYVQGMALTYAIAGAISAAVFQTAPQATFQQPWILITFAVLFIALAFAMFGAYTLQMPSALQTRLADVSNRQKGGTYIGTFIMGALSALIVTACVAPAVVGALSVLAQAGSVPRGAGALYAMGLGMGVPLLLVGASAGSLLPKVGPWMDTIKNLFGVVFLGLAIYIVNPLLPSAVSMLLWAALAIISGFWIFSLKNPNGAPIASPVRGAGLLILVYGILLLIGAASGGRDPIQPLDRGRFATASGAVASGQLAAADHGLAFERIKTVADLDGKLAAASQAGRPVMLDFYADWCVSCKEMEKYTFTDPGVQAQLANAVLLQADVTANDDADKELMKRFGIFGPPTIAFFGVDGAERKNYRLVGFSPAEKFRDHVQDAFSKR